MLVDTNCMKKTNLFLGYYYFMLLNIKKESHKIITVYNILYLYILTVFLFYFVYFVEFYFIIMYVNCILHLLHM